MAEARAWARRRRAGLDAAAAVGPGGTPPCAAPAAHPVELPRGSTPDPAGAGGVASPLQRDMAAQRSPPAAGEGPRLGEEGGGRPSGAPAAQYRSSADRRRLRSLGA
eukprot:12945247-Alexandrium_andersonii.AAC.1